MALIHRMHVAMSTRIQRVFSRFSVRTTLTMTTKIKTTLKNWTKASHAFAGSSARGNRKKTGQQQQNNEIHFLRAGCKTCFRDPVASVNRR